MKRKFTECSLFLSSHQGFFLLFVPSFLYSIFFHSLFSFVYSIIHFFLLSVFLFVLFVSNFLAFFLCISRLRSHFLTYLNIPSFFLLSFFLPPSSLDPSPDFTVQETPFIITIPAVMFTSCLYQPRHFRGGLCSHLSAENNYCYGLQSDNQRICREESSYVKILSSIVLLAITYTFFQITRFYVKL